MDQNLHVCERRKAKKLEQCRENSNLELAPEKLEQRKEPVFLAESQQDLNPNLAGLESRSEKGSAIR